MALPRLNYQQPDYLDQIGQGVGAVARVAEGLQPAHPFIAQALRRIYSGENPRAVAIETKFAMQRQQLPSMPDMPAQAQAPAPQAPAQAPRQLRGQVMDTTGEEPPEAVGMRGTMRSSLGPEGGFTGPREFTGPEEVVSAPRQPLPLMSDPATMRAPQTPILNRDVPQLMQGAGLMRRDEMGDLRALELDLARQRLAENQRQFNAQESLRQAREELIRAQASGIPERIRMAEENLQARWASIGVAQGGLATRRAENYLRGAGPGLEVVTGMDDLVRQGVSNPEIVGTGFDFTIRRAADVAQNLPVLGKFVASLATTAADERLTPAQLEFKQRAAAETSGFIHSRFGSQLTGNELQLANKILGGNLSVVATLSGLMVLRHIAARKVQIYQRVYGDVAAQVGYPDEGSLPILPGGG